MLTLEDDKIGLEARVRHLKLLNLGLQALTNALRDGSAIDLGASHCRPGKRAERGDGRKIDVQWRSRPQTTRPSSGTQWSYIGGRRREETQRAIDLEIKTTAG